MGCGLFENNSGEFMASEVALAAERLGAGCSVADRWAAAWSWAQRSVAERPVAECSVVGRSVAGRSVASCVGSATCASAAFRAQASLSVTADFDLLGMFRNGAIGRPFRPMSIYRGRLRGQQ